MAVIVGSARIDENGKARGGKPGDQTGRELSTQNWYLHSKGWRVFRAIDSAKAEKMAWAMQKACDSSYIGYDQGDRLTLYYIARDVGFDISKIKTKCETDCSALVRVCAAYAGITLPNFTTPNEPRVLLDSHEFVEMVGDKYTKASTYLKRGDVLVTKTQGHTVIVLSDGPKAENNIPAPKTYELGDRILRNGYEGNDVKQLQSGLIELGFNCGSWGADGDFGDATELAVKAFQAHTNLKEDGEVGPLTLKALENALVELHKNDGQKVTVIGGNCYVRTEPNTNGSVLGVAREGETLEYRGETSEAGWLAVLYREKNGWLSGKYGKLVK